MPSKANNFKDKILRILSSGDSAQISQLFRDSKHYQSQERGLFHQCLKENYATRIDEKLDDEDRTLLHYATINGANRSLSYLLQLGASVAAKTKYTTTALEEAIYHKNCEAIKLLVDANANLENEDENGHNAYDNLSLIISGETDKKKQQELREIFEYIVKKRAPACSPKELELLEEISIAKTLLRLLYSSRDCGIPKLVSLATIMLQITHDANFPQFKNIEIFREILQKIPQQGSFEIDGKSYELRISALEEHASYYLVGDDFVYYLDGNGLYDGHNTADGKKYTYTAAKFKIDRSKYDKTSMIERLETVTSQENLEEELKEIFGVSDENFPTLSTLSRVQYRGNCPAKSLLVVIQFLLEKSYGFAASQVEGNDLKGEVHEMHKTFKNSLINFCVKKLEEISQLKNPLFAESEKLLEEVKENSARKLHRPLAERMASVSVLTQFT